MPDFIIRPLAARDEPQWRVLWTAYLHFYETDVDDAVKAETFRRNLSPDHPDQNALVAATGETLIGLVHYIYHSHNWRLEPVCYLQDLFTAAEARGQGAGRALIEAVYAAADAHGAPSVYWLTQDFNAPARHLYDRIATLTPFIKYQR
ncbi:MAG: GNAT family N-acetyltransferase [Pseudomonadota bacterium]